MNTIENIMALANAYAESYRDALAPNVNALVDEAQTALRTALTEALAKDASLICDGTKAQPVREPANWYCIDKIGRATLCADADDALQNAKIAAWDWPDNAPYRAVQLVENTTRGIGGEQ